jgi:hypothetical protein
MKLASGFIIGGMTRRDAALLTLTLAGMLCLFNATTMLITITATPAESMASHGSSVQRLLSVLPIAILSCAGFALLQSRRRFSTRIFGANPSHDATAQVDAGDMRLLAVRVIGFLLLSQCARSAHTAAENAADFISTLTSVLMSAVAPLILGVGAALCFIRGGTVVRWLFAAGPGEGKSARYRDNFAFALGVIGAFYVLTFTGGLVSGLAQLMTVTRPVFGGRAFLFFTTCGADLAMLILGIALFLGRRALAAFWSKLHPMGSDTP